MNNKYLAVFTLSALTGFTVTALLVLLRAVAPVVADFSQTVAGLPDVAAVVVIIAAALVALKNI